ncbi:hypothetical protein Tco_0421466 [Tanacetum coccineum]
MVGQARAGIINSEQRLLSSYAVEVMTIHVIQKFNASLGTPLEVLKTFIEYYTKFKWHPDNKVSTDDEFRYIVKKCSFRAGESKYKTFRVKGIDVVDPIDKLNNIGSEKVIEIFTAMKQAHDIAFNQGVQGVFTELLNQPRVASSSPSCCVDTNYKDIVASSSPSCCMDTNYKDIYYAIEEAQGIYRRGPSVLMHHPGFDINLGLVVAISMAWLQAITQPRRAQARSIQPSAQQPEAREQDIASNQGVQGVFTELLNRPRVASSSPSCCVDTNYKDIYYAIEEAQGMYRRGPGVLMHHPQPPHHGGYDGHSGFDSQFGLGGGYFYGFGYHSQFERGGRYFDGPGYYRQQPHHGYSNWPQLQAITQPRQRPATASSMAGGGGGGAWGMY